MPGFRPEPSNCGHAAAQQPRKSAKPAPSNLSSNRLPATCRWTPPTGASLTSKMNERLQMFSTVRSLLYSKAAVFKLHPAAPSLCHSCGQNIRPVTATVLAKFSPGQVR